MRKLANRSNSQTNILVNVSLFKEPLTCPGNLRWKMLHSVAHSCPIRRKTVTKHK